MIWNPKKSADECWHCGGVHSTSECFKPAPSPQPEMPEGWECVTGEDGALFFINEGLKRVLTMSRIKSLLATQGLAIVPAAEVMTPAKQAVLDAAEEASRRLLVMIESLEADEDGSTNNDLLLVDLDGIRSLPARRGGGK
jgi:hypothetical protein